VGALEVWDDVGRKVHGREGKLETHKTQGIPSSLSELLRGALG
jgi:hypothetical protein